MEASLAISQVDMAHGCAYPFDMHYRAANRRMVYSGYHAQDSCYAATEEELAHCGMGAACGPAGWKGMPTQAIDIDFRGMKGGRGDPRKQSQVKKELVVFPRRKAGQSKRQADNEAPVKLTPEIQEEIAAYGRSSKNQSTDGYSWEEPASVEKLYFVEQHDDAVRF